MHIVLWCHKHPRFPAFWCSRSLSPQPCSVPGVQASNPLVSQDLRSQPHGVLEVLALSSLGDSRPSNRSSSLSHDFPNSGNRPGPAPPLICRPYSLPSTSGDCGFWTWQPGPHHSLSRLGPQHACCLHRQPLFLLCFCC